MPSMHSPQRSATVVTDLEMARMRIAAPSGGGGSGTRVSERLECGEWVRSGDGGGNGGRGRRGKKGACEVARQLTDCGARPSRCPRRCR